ncbi:MAG: DnaB-like helicase C-terminal domain-containing protein, partial [Elusimicrobiota bacterium]|nr:DnaB-like helicase C-terminal domain-containing protein [Elusimicrobiota bacterium]
RDAAFNCEVCKDLIEPASRLRESPLCIVDGEWNTRMLSTMLGIANGEILPGNWDKKMSDNLGLIIVDTVTSVWDRSRHFRSSREHQRAILAKLKKLAIEKNVVVVGVVPVLTPHYGKRARNWRPQVADLENVYGKEEYSDIRLFMHAKPSSSETIYVRERPVSHKQTVDIYLNSTAAKTTMSYDPMRASFSDLYKLDKS